MSGVDPAQGDGATVSWLPLVARIAVGDRAAEESLVRHFRDGVHALARRHCRPNDPAVDDITQDVICHILERLRHGAIKDAMALPAYIRTAVVNACTTEYRRRRLRGEAAPFDELAVEPVETNDPSDSLQAQHLTLAIRQLVSEMPVQRDRELLVRFYLNEADKAEICSDLGIESGHFHRVIHRARERFRKLLERSGLITSGETTAPLATPERLKARAAGQRSA